LLNISRETGDDLNFILKRFAGERWLYRLGRSEHAERFLLKGASLFRLWFNEPHRPTRDIDLLGFGPADMRAVAKAVNEVCSVETDDGLVFDTKSVRVEEIREGQEYQGVRATVVAMLGRARITVQIDVGFGDAVTPAADHVVFPVLLDMPKPQIRAYPKETVVAEKFEAMVKLGMANSRMKDFWDLDLLTRSFEFDGWVLIEAILATFDRRQTRVPTNWPTALTNEFYEDATKKKQWKAFLTRNSLMESDLGTTIERLRTYFGPVIEATKVGQFRHRWNKQRWMEKE
jgi:predicted nucleotidyltransferase component of viral defense system